jgi:parallel beta-helix repeat protein
MRVARPQRTRHPWGWAAALASLAVLGAGLAMWLAAVPTPRVGAVSLVVDNLDDDPAAAKSACTAAANDCSLRGALSVANGNGASDTITFASGLSGTIPSTLAFTLSDAAAGTIIDGPVTAGTPDIVIGCAAGDGFTISTANNTIQDLVINSCTNGVHITGPTASSNTITNNRIGTNAIGTAAVGNTTGVRIDLGADSNTISNNLISGNTNGIAITGAGTNANKIQGNLIGTDVNGTGQLANTAHGIGDASASGTIIGGTLTAHRNIISGNTLDGIQITGTGATVQGNCIGTTSNCLGPLGNGNDGIEIVGGTGVLVGGTPAGAGNVIQWNSGDGVSISGGGANNRVTRNTIALNGDQGIDCSTAAGSSKTCDLGQENVPPPTILGCADAGGGNVTCNGSVPGPTFNVAGLLIDVYRANDDGGGPEGDAWLCSWTTGTGGAWGCTFPNPGGGSVTATTTTLALSTSEFSGPMGIPPGVGPTATLTPTNTPTRTPTSTSTPPTPTPTLTLTPTPTATGTPPTSTPTPTVTGTPPTATPTLTDTPTATPTTGAMELIPLVIGCNFESSTFPDNTSPATLVAAISPSANIAGIWAQQPPPRWKGYNPFFPTASDMLPVDTLDVVAICMRGSGTFTRPVV